MEDDTKDSRNRVNVKGSQKRNDLKGTLPDWMSGKSKSVEKNVPTLRYGPNNNYVEFKKRLSLACHEKYKGLGRVIEDEEYWTPEEVDRSLYPLENDPDNVMKSCLLEAVKMRVKEISEMKNARPSMYAFIMSRLSRESEDAIKRHEFYDAFHSAKNPKALWLAIKETHLITTVSNLDSVIKKEARDEYHKCRQGEFEPISEFKERFTTRLESYLAQGNVQMSDEDIAMDFLKGLCYKHSRGLIVSWARVDTVRRLGG